VIRNKQTHLSSSRWRGHSRGAASWSGCNRVTVRSDHESSARQRHYHARHVRV